MSNTKDVSPLTARFRELLEKATKGPWKTETALCPKTELGLKELGDGPSDVYQTHIVQERPGMYGLHAPVVASWASPYYEPQTAVFIKPEDAALIVEAVNNLPTLLDAHDDATAEIARLRADVRALRSDLESAFQKHALACEGRDRALAEVERVKREVGK